MRAEPTGPEAGRRDSWHSRCATPSTGLAATLPRGWMRVTDTLGSYLAALRAQAGWTLRELGARSGVSNGYLSLLEHDKVKQPSPRALWAVAQSYGTDYLGLM